MTLLLTSCPILLSKTTSVIFQCQIVLTLTVRLFLKYSLLCLLLVVVSNATDWNLGVESGEQEADEIADGVSSGKIL